MRKFQPNEIRFILYCEPEDMPIRGNVMASGDDEADREAEDAVIADLESGNQWAWCCVTITAEWAGFTGRAVLGGVSHKAAEEFCIPGGYYDDMIHEALADLLNEIKEAGWSLDMGPGDSLDVAKARAHETMEIQP